MPAQQQQMIHLSFDISLFTDRHRAFSNLFDSNKSFYRVEVQNLSTVSSLQPTELKTQITIKSHFLFDSNNLLELPGLSRYCLGIS